jgi:hypothetical protein
MSRDLVGTAWLDSDERTRWETRIMRRRVPLYRWGIAALRALNTLTGGPNRPSLKVSQWERIGPNGETFVMDKLETMTGRTDHPVTSRAELRARTSLASWLGGRSPQMNGRRSSRSTKAAGGASVRSTGMSGTAR